MINRLLKLKTLINTEDLDAVLISSPAHITYLTNFSAFTPHEREAFLLISTNSQYIITDGRYSEAVIEKVKDFQLIEVSIRTPLKKILNELSKKLKIKRLGVEENNITVAEGKLFKRHFPQISPINLISLRIIKEPEEIRNIKQACNLGDKAFEYILKKIKLGMSEKEIAFELELFIKKQGADISFPAIVAFGKNSSVPHHQTSNQRLASSGQFILLDFGVKLDNYCSDMTRTIFFGSANAEFKKIYQTVLEAQTRAIDFLIKSCHSERSEESDIRASEIDKVARDHIIFQGYPTIPHSLGHGIGIEVHESPRLSPKSKDILKPGMVFSIEPGIYLPGFGGVRIEDLVVLEKSKPRLLTHASKELIELN